MHSASRLVVAVAVMALSVTATAQDRTFTSSFIALNGASIGAAALDVALTRHCIDSGTCREGNPLMAGGPARQYGIALGLAGASAFVSYKIKRQGSKAWIVAPIVSLTTHGIGAGFALRFQEAR